MGITSDFPVTRSLALGVAQVSVLDMASAYSVFASQGYKTPGYGILKIDTLRGKNIYTKDVDAPRPRVLSLQTVGYMDQMMRAVVTGGTGVAAQIPGVPAVGKTGTTSDYRDAWFFGFTGNYVAVVWYGNDDYHEMKQMTGGTLPAITWQKFMAYAHTNIAIKPVYGVDFTPAPFLIATAADGKSPAAEPERPPTLKPAAADKLLDLADQLHAALRQPGSDGQVAALAVSGAPAGSL
jgi:penicillin-binding protein 1A